MNKQIIFLVGASVFLTSCSIFNAYQPPAPVYGDGERTNPYYRETPDKPLESERQVYVQPKIETQPAAIVEKSIASETSTVVVKRVAPPAILALVTEANRSSRAGDLESAVVTIERALRIDARNPDLTYKLAQLRLKQSKPRLAEDLAKKAAMLAVNDKALKKQSWLLISEARRQQKKYVGAKEAKLKADKL